MSVKTNLRIIHFYHEGMTYRRMALWFGISRGTLGYRLLKLREAGLIGHRKYCPGKAGTGKIKVLIRRLTRQ